MTHLEKLIYEGKLRGIVALREKSITTKEVRNLARRFASASNCSTKKEIVQSVWIRGDEEALKLLAEFTGESPRRLAFLGAITRLRKKPFTGAPWQKTPAFARGFRQGSAQHCTSCGRNTTVAR